MKNTLLIHFVCVIFAASFTTINAQSMSHTLSAPVAKKLPKQLKKHNEIRIDDYYWLNDRENPEVIDYLNQELTGNALMFMVQDNLRVGLLTDHIPVN